MADPVSASAGIGMGSKAAASIVGAYGAYESGQAQSAMYQYQAGVAQANQQIQEQNASYALFSGEVQAQQAGMQVRAQIGETKADQGASGLDVGSGSAARVRDSEFEVGQENIGIIRSNAAKTAYGYDVSAWQYGTQATADQAAASQAKKAGTINAISSLLGGSASVASSWFQGQSVGIGGSYLGQPGGAG